VTGLATGVAACLCVTVVDGLVLARSAFNHSMNYRSVVAFGTAVAVGGDEKLNALRCISEHVLPGRWDTARPPSATELEATGVVRMELDEASAKIRRGGPKDEPEDLSFPVWAGVLPCTVVWGEPVPDDGVDSALSPPPPRRI
jgi:nitroimidazol reductase NimA-like FMN-containing flavoprotein (pyridoxamine 5'-phosphate oxidase superfamily)